MKKWIYLAFIVLTSCSSENAPPKYERSVPVEEGIAVSKDVPIYIETLGTVHAHNTVQLTPEVQGRILNTHVKQGDYVKKGEFLYSINPKTYQAIVDKAQAVLEKDKAHLVFANQKLDRHLQLKDKEFISEMAIEEMKSNVDALKAQVQSDQAELDLAKINLDHCCVYSPINGKISQFHVDVGNLVKAYDSNALTEILEIQPVEIRFSFPQKYFLELKKQFGNHKLHFFISDSNNPQKEFTQKEFHGVVDFINNKIDSHTGTILLKGTVDNRDELLWPGAFVWVKLHLRTEDQATLVPKSAISIGQQGPYLYVINADQTAELRNVILGEESDDQVIVTSGVNPGECVVTNGQINLRPSCKVCIKKSEENHEHL